MRTDHIDRFNAANEQYIRVCRETVDQITMELERAKLALRTAEAVASKEVMALDAVRPPGEKPIPAFLAPIPAPVLEAAE
jgi:hypothetical protein